MKSTDGFELKKNHYYYLENGQCVILNDFAETPDGEQRFIVTPFYEGETMTVSGDGGSHCEYTAEYEHEGEETMVEFLFDSAPIEKLCSRYTSKLKDIESLSLASGRLTKDINDLKLEKLKLERHSEELKKNDVLMTSQSSGLREIKEKLISDVDSLRQKVSEFEDQLAEVTISGEFVSVSRAKYGRLNKRDFELSCLENGGVDNWEWYSESLKDYHLRYPEG